MNLKLSCSVMFFILIIISCDDNPTEPGNQSKELWPFKTGNQWVWKYTRLDSLGNIKEIKYDTLTVVGTMAYEGNVWYLIETSDNDTVMYSFIEGRLCRLDKGDLDYYIRPFFKYPASIGETYNVNNDTTFLCTVKSLNEQVICPAGKFATIKYELGRKSSSQDYRINEYSYFCPGIGLVRDEFLGRRYDKSTYISSIIELQSYKLE